MLMLKVYEKFFNKDEIEFANKEFRDLFNILMELFQINGFFVLMKKLVTNFILCYMAGEKHFTLVDKKVFIAAV